MKLLLAKILEALNFLASIATYIILLVVMIVIIYMTFGDYYQGQWEFFNDYHNNRAK